MRKVLFSLLLILIFGMGTTAKAEVLDRVEVPIFNDKGNNQTGRPKAPEIIPITCVYENGVLFFEFCYDLGTISVIVTNVTTGEQWQTLLPTTGIATMNISEESENYNIEITTINNKVYYGDFEIL